MPLSYICEFNLNSTGEKAEKYLAKILRQWPALYSELTGVRGTLLLANAFGLGGPYTYLWRVDIDSFGTLQTIDDAIKSSDKRWRQARADWFQNRSAVRARLLNIDADDKTYLRSAAKGREGLLHFTLAYGQGEPGGAEELKGSAKSFQDKLVKSFGNSGGVHAVQHLSTAIQPSGEVASGEVWVRLANLKALDDFSRTQTKTVAPLLGRRRTATGLFGELREVEGALIAGA